MFNRCLFAFFWSFLCCLVTKFDTSIFECHNFSRPKKKIEKVRILDWFARMNGIVGKDFCWDTFVLRHLKSPSCMAKNHHLKRYRKPTKPADFFRVQVVRSLLGDET